tara:strand:- start:313 stop:675 length:363 start_codon:yes stop_codon:yes gene_type:complete
MTAPVGKAPSVTEKKVAEPPKKPERKFDPSAYSCEIILEKTSKELAMGKKYPTDAFMVYYNFEGVDYIDLTRSYKMVNVFDMYFDRYGKGSVKNIEHGYGNITPSQWGYKAPERKKKRKL